MHSHKCVHDHGGPRKIYKARRGIGASREIVRLADKLEPKVKAAFLQSIAKLKSRTSIAELKTVIQNNDVAAFENLVMEEFRSSMSTTLAVLRGGYYTAGDLEATKVPKRLSPKGFVFDQFDPRAVEFVNTYDFNLIRELDFTTRLGLRTTFRDSIEIGVPPVKVAQTLRSMIGLTESQSTAVSKRINAAKLGGASQEKLDRLRDQLTSRKLKDRAINIARTETIRSLNAGQNETWKQMIDDKIIPQNVSRVWITTPDERLCPICESLDGMEVGFADKFSTTISLSETKTATYTQQYPPSHPACYSDDTRVYTRKGFELFEDVTMGDDCLSLNLDTLKLGWVPVIATQAYDYDGDMLHFCSDNNSVDLLVTPDHSQPVFREGKPLFVRADEVRHTDTLYLGFDCSAQVNCDAQVTKNTKAYKGMVYDVSLARNHTLLVERNGRAVWSGNCRCTLGLIYPDDV